MVVKVGGEEEEEEKTTSQGVIRQENLFKPPTVAFLSD